MTSPSCPITMGCEVARAQRRGAYVGNARSTSELVFLLALLLLSCISLLGSPRIRHLGEDALLHFVASQQKVFAQYQPDQGRAVRVLVEQSDVQSGAASGADSPSPTDGNRPATTAKLIATDDLLFKPFAQAAMDHSMATTHSVHQSLLPGDMSFESTSNLGVQGAAQGTDTQPAALGGATAKQHASTDNYAETMQQLKQMEQRAAMLDPQNQGGNTTAATLLNTSMEGLFALPPSEASLPMPTLADGPYAGLPMDFDVEQYKMYHPDLHTAGFVSDHDVKLHYLQYGRMEGRLYKRTRLILRYTACSGLMNQQYSHVAAFALAVSLGAEIILPPAATRNSFGKHFSVYSDKNEVIWRPAPLDTLLDVQGIITHWKEKGLTVHAHLDLDQLVERVRFATVGAASTMLRNNPDMDVGYLVVDLPCTFFMLRTPSAMPLVGEVALSLTFARPIQALASLVIQALGGAQGNGAAGEIAKYNGVHLRIEKDAQDWSTTLGGQQAVWNGYLGAMQAAGFASDLPLYVATGLLTYGANEDMQLTEHRLQTSGLCSQVVYKEHVLTPEQLQGLNPEQEALLDFIVLLNSRSFVGFGASTFSFYLQELRTLRGVPRKHSVLVDASIIGTDPLFHLAGYLSDPVA